jgi:glucokinase
MGSENLLLAGDIGGTKTQLALYEQAGEALLAVRSQSYPSAQYPDLESIISEFLRDTSDLPKAACFGVAGPVNAGRSQITNLPWVIEETALIAHSGIPAVRVLNDLQAMALGLLNLPAEELLEINPNAQARIGNIGVIAAGTGCGEAILYWDGKNYHAIPTESGHGDFAPNSPEQDGLLCWLRTQFGGHVSYERIISGPGLYSVYQYLREAGVAKESAAFRAAVAEGGDASALISRLALEQNDALCTAALRLFVQIYGAEAGNLALRTLAQGGVLIGGGIAAKILPAMTNGDFLVSFCDKGRFAGWMGTLSVKIALNPNAGLLGAAQGALGLLK